MSDADQAKFSARITNIGNGHKEIKPRDPLEVTMHTEIDPDSLTLQLASPDSNYSNMGVLIMKKTDVRKMNVTVGDIVTIKIAKSA